MQFTDDCIRTLITNDDNNRGSCPPALQEFYLAIINQNLLIFISFKRILLPAIIQKNL